MSFEGMDVGVMRRVSRDLQTQGQVLDHLISNIESTVGHAQQVWQGQDLAAFVHGWQSSLRTMLLAASSSLQQLATSTAANADQQELGSQATGAIGQPIRRSANGPTSDGSGYLTLAGLLHGATDLLTHGSHLPAVKLLGEVGVPLAGIGLGFALVDFTEGVRTHNGAQEFMGGLDAAGTFTPPEIGFPIAAFSAYVHYTIPVSDNDQWSLLDYQAQSMFHTDRQDLTSAQAQALSDRYTGAMGPLNMISDKMNQSWDNSIGSLVPSLKTVQ